MTSVTFCWPPLPPLEVKYFTIYTNQTRNPKKQDKKSWRICYDAFSPSLPLTDLSFSQSHIPNEGPICLLYAIVMYLLVLIWLSNPSPTDFCDFDPNFFAEEYSNFFFSTKLWMINIVNSNGSVFCLHNGWLPTILLRYLWQNLPHKVYVLILSYSSILVQICHPYRLTSLLAMSVISTKSFSRGKFLIGAYLVISVWNNHLTLNSLTLR